MKKSIYLNNLIMSVVDEDNKLVQISLDEKLRLVDDVYDGNDPISTQLRMEKGVNEENHNENVFPILWIIKTFHKFLITAKYMNDI